MASDTCNISERNGKRVLNVAGNVLGNHTPPHQEHHDFLAVERGAPIACVVKASQEGSLIYIVSASGEAVSGMHTRDVCATRRWRLPQSSFNAVV